MARGVAVPGKGIRGLLVDHDYTPLVGFVVRKREVAPVEASPGLCLPLRVPAWMLQDVERERVGVYLGIGIVLCADVLKEWTPSVVPQRVCLEPVRHQP